MLDRKYDKITIRSDLKSAINNEAYRHCRGLLIKSPNEPDVRDCALDFLEAFLSENIRVIEDKPAAPELLRA
jgi:hypothetical protein